MALSFVSPSASPLVPARADAPPKPARPPRGAATPEVLQNVRDLRGQGLSLKAIAAKLHVKESSVSYWMYSGRFDATSSDTPVIPAAVVAPLATPAAKPTPTPPPRRVFTAADRQLIKEKRRAGLTHAQITAETGWSKSTIERVARGKKEARS